MSLMNYKPVSEFGETGRKLEKIIAVLTIIGLIAVVGTITFKFYEGYSENTKKALEQEEARQAEKRAFQALVGPAEEDVKTFTGKLSQYIFPESAEWFFIDTIPTGKFLPLDKESNEVDYLYFSMPKELRATNPSEVKTVVWIDCSRKIVGVYADREKKNKENAHKYICRCYFVNNENHSPLGVKDFVGDDPPKEIKVMTSNTGDKSYDVDKEPKPYKSIIYFLQGHLNTF